MATSSPDRHNTEIDYAYDNDVQDDNDDEISEKLSIDRNRCTRNVTVSAFSEPMEELYIVY